MPYPEIPPGWAGQVALVTGAGTGIGLGVARALSDAGLRLALTYRDPAQAEAVTAQFAAEGRAAPLLLPLDVTDRARWAEIVAQTVAQFGALHVLINNAGVSVFGNADEASHADYDWIMGVNFGGVANGLVAALPAIKAAHGKRGVVNVASMAAFLPGPQAGLYTASKFAVRGLTESLRYNLAPHGITCALCCPALTRTNAWDSALKRPAAYAQSGFGPVDEAALRQFGTAFEAGMDPDEVGRKIVAGLVRGDGLILTHPEFADDFREIYEDSLVALPQEEAPPARLEIERLRRAAMAQARAGIAVGLADLT